MLVRGITKDEVYEALMSFPSGKSLGPDGLNAEFYRFFWEDIGEFLFNDVN